MALFRQPANKQFDINEGQLDAMLRGERVAPQAQNDAQPNLQNTAPDVDAIGLTVAAQDDAKPDILRDEEAVTSPFSTANPATFDEWSTQQRRQEGAEQAGYAIVNQGPTNQLSREEIEEKKREQSAEALEGMVEAGEERRRKEQDRELADRWEKEKFNFFGDEMSEEEWNTAKKNIRDPKMRAAIKNKLIADGTPQDKAQRAIDIADEVLHLNDRVKKGEITAADAQRRKDELKVEVENDPDLRVAVPKAKELAKNGLANDRSAVLDTTKDARAENQGASLGARDSMLAATDVEVPAESVTAATSSPGSKSATNHNLHDEKLFASAPPVGEHFAVVASGIVQSQAAAPKVAPAATMAAAVKPDALVC